MSYSGHERDRFFYNLGDGRFRPIGYSVGLDDTSDGRANVAFDYDGDGDLDLAVLSLQKLRLLENRATSENHFVRFTLRATRTEHHALGAVVRVRSASHDQVDYVTATSGFASAVPLRLHFGLRDDTIAEEVQVTWPSGHVDTFEDVPVDQHWLLVEGRETPKPVPLVRWSERLEDSAMTREFTLPDSLRTLSGERVAVEARARPTVVNLWASWCVACRSELPDLAKLAEARTDIDVIGVSLDEEPSAAREFVSRYSVGFKNYLADDELLTRFFRDKTVSVRLPATFVLDGRGQLRRAFFRQVSAQDVERALRTIETVELATGDADLLAARGLQRLRLGRSEEAIELLSDAIRVNPRHVQARTNLAAAYTRSERLPDAVTELEELVQHDPKNAEAYSNLGMLLHELGRHGEAIERFREAREREASSDVSRYYLASCLIEEGRIAEARSVAEAWVASAPTHADAQKLLVALTQMERATP